MAYKIEENQERAGPFGRLRVNEPDPYKTEEKPRSRKAVSLDRKSPPFIPQKARDGEEFANFAKDGAPSSTFVERFNIGARVRDGRVCRRRLRVTE